MNCPNNGAPLLRWPYFQHLGEPGTTYGHCPWCMRTFPVSLEVPEHGK